MFLVVSHIRYSSFISIDVVVDAFHYKVIGERGGGADEKEGQQNGA